MLSQVQTALETLDPLDREILTLRHFEELGNNEVAELLGLQKAAASNRYVRALGRLRQALSKVPGFFDDDEKQFRIARAAMNDLAQSDPDRHPVDVVAEQFAERCRRGERPSVSDFANRHPEIADQLREILPPIA